MPRRPSATPPPGVPAAGAAIAAARSGIAPARPRARQLARERHAVWQLEPGLLLVFKPRGHVESTHSHGWAQRLFLLAGRLEVVLPRRTARIDARHRALRVPAGAAHHTRALADTWLVAERVDRRAPAPARSRPRAGRG